MVADSHGTIWDSVFRVRQVGDQTHLQLEMESRGYKLFSKVMNVLIHPMVKKAVGKDMDQLKAYLES